MTATLEADMSVEETMSGMVAVVPNTVAYVGIWDEGVGVYKDAATVVAMSVTMTATTMAEDMYTMLEKDAVMKEVASVVKAMLTEQGILEAGGVYNDEWCCCQGRQHDDGICWVGYSSVHRPKIA